MVNGRRVTGGRVLLPCEVKNGFFPDESSYHIVIDGAAVRRVIIGHVSSDTIVQKNGSRFVPGLVMESYEKGSARVFLPGELVSDTNPVTVPFDWLSQFL
jgi:deoxycytidine triphosphate deaminase